jgi:integral membrane sensor domain MASE1
LSKNDDRWTWGWQVSLLAAIYFATGTYGLQLATFREGVTLVWGPTGISLAALLLFGPRLWPGVFLGALLVNLGNPSANVPSAFVIAIGNTLEAVVGVALLVRLADFRSSLERIRDVISFLLIGVLGCTTISATIGVAAYYGFGFLDAADIPTLWMNWWLGDLGGALIMTPMLLILVRGSPAWTVLAHKAETWIALLSLIAISSLTFFGPALGLLGFAACVSGVPVLVWAGTRLGQRGATTASFIMILIATAAAIAGTGPFALGTESEAMILLWSWAILIATTGYTLAAAVEERNTADRKHEIQEIDRLQIEKQKLLLLERERLTREMQVGLGSQLVSALAMVERGHAPPNQIAESLRRVLDDLRIIIDSLDPSTMDLPTSLGKLRARVEPLLRRNGASLSWHVGAEVHSDILGPEDVLHTLRIIQEAIANTLRHAHARHIELSLAVAEEEPRSLRLSICDDGCGLPNSDKIGGRGIENMKARASTLGATLSIESRDTGTSVDLTIPLRPRSQR